MPTPRSLDKARCPRCGYDLRGTVSTWVETSPVYGTCPECGLTFPWAELFSAAFSVPRWCVEAPEPRWRLPKQAAGTFVRSWRPWRFWSALRMSHPSRWGRVAAYLGLITVIVYAAFALTHGVAAWRFWHGFAVQGGYAASTDGWPVFWQAMVLPLSNESIGSFTVRGRGFVWPYRTPWELFGYYWDEMGQVLVTMLIMHVGCGLTYAALPITRRRCRVRSEHIVRVTLYGFVLVLPAVLISLPAQPAAMAGGAIGALLAPPAALAWAAIPFLEVAWWSAATARYLRMPHAWGVGISVTIVGGLGALAIMTWIVMEPLSGY